MYLHGLEELQDLFQIQGIKTFRREDSCVLAEHV